LGHLGVKFTDNAAEVVKGGLSSRKESLNVQKTLKPRKKGVGLEEKRPPCVPQRQRVKRGAVRIRGGAGGGRKAGRGRRKKTALLTRANCKSKNKGEEALEVSAVEKPALLLEKKRERKRATRLAREEGRGGKTG